MPKELLVIVIVSCLSYVFLLLHRCVFFLYLIVSLNYKWRRLKSDGFVVKVNVA